MPENFFAILTYHAIDERDSVISVSPARFRSQMEALGRLGMRGVSLAEAFDHLDRAGHFPADAVALTFDDGYRSVYEEAVPVMTSMGFSATLFIATRVVGMTGSEACEINADIDRDLMSWDQMAELAREGFEIGAHSMNHPDLRQVAGVELDAQVVKSGQYIAETIGRPVQSFAYPYGYFDDTTRAAVSGAYRFACTTRLGHVSPGDDRLTLKRLDAYYLGREEIFSRACMGGLGAWWAFRQSLRDFRERWSGRV